MTRNEHVLWIVAEESAEIGQRASKAARFGMDEIQPEQNLNNRGRLWYEFADLCGALELLNEGCVIEEVVRSLRPQIDAKKIKVEHFLKYSAECGTLDEGEI